MTNHSKERIDVLLTLELSCSTGEPPWPDRHGPILTLDQRLELYLARFESDGGYIASVKDGDLPVLANAENAKVTIVVSSPEEHVSRFATGARATLAASQFHLADVEIESVTPGYWGGKKNPG